jgi:hypothetical protein
VIGRYGSKPGSTVDKIKFKQVWVPRRDLGRAATTRRPESHLEEATARHRDPEQECDGEACERRFPGDGADGCKRLAGLPRRRDRLGRPNEAVTFGYPRVRSI